MRAARAWFANRSKLARGLCDTFDINPQPAMKSPQTFAESYSTKLPLLRGCRRRIRGSVLSAA